MSVHSIWFKTRPSDDAVGDSHRGVAQRRFQKMEEPSIGDALHNIFPGEFADQSGGIRLRPAGERRYFTPSRSTSNISVAPGGMSPPAPLAP